MRYEEALLYGAVQGVAEYLPISSSAHLILLPKFLNQTDPGLTFDVFLHLGTLMATLIYFWKDWQGVFSTVPGVGKYFHASKKSDDLGKAEVVSWKFIAIATIPALIAGAGLHKWVETVLRGNAVLMTTLMIGGILLVLADRFCPQKKTLRAITMKDALFVGIAQCFALVPGMSRSGSTMIGGRLIGFDRAAAARFSFLISAPVTAAALVFELRNWDKLFDGTIAAGPLIVAGVSSFVFGCLAIGGMLRLLRNFGFMTFAVYRVVLAVVIYRVLGV